MNDKVLATVVIPSLNNARSLRRSLDILNGQTARPQLRILVVDNGSVDNSVAIASELADEVYVEGTPGSAAARNLGLSLVQSDLYLSLDADCWPMTNLWAAAYIGAMSTRTSDICGATGPLAPAPSSDRWAMRADITPRAAFGPDHVPLYGVGGNSCYLTAAMRQVGGFPPFRADDVALGSRLRAAGLTLRWVEEAAVYHSNREGPKAYFHQTRKVGWYSAEAAHQAGESLQTSTVDYARKCWRVGKATLVQGPAEGYATLLKVVGHEVGKREFRAAVGSSGPLART